jgi:hypothetical protein
MQNEPLQCKRYFVLVICLVLISVAGCQRRYKTRRTADVAPPASVAKPLPPKASPQLKQLIDSAIEQTKVTTGYDPAYVGIDYPGGDVSSETGVCSDVVVRAFRKAGLDLQKEVHEDNRDAFGPDRGEMFIATHHPSKNLAQSGAPCYTGRS